MTTLYTTYIAITGEIKGNFMSPNEIPPELNAGESIIEGWYAHNDFYINLNTDTPTLKSLYPIIQSDNSFFNIPVDTKATIPPAANDPFGAATEVVISDGTLTVTYNYPGTYSISFTNFKFIDQSYEVIVT